MASLPPGSPTKKYVNNSLQFTAEDHDKLEIQPQCGNETLLKLTGPSHGYETHAPSLMVKLYQVRLQYLLHVWWRVRKICFL